MKNWRFYVLIFFIFACFSAITFRLFNLQIVQHSSYQDKAAGQQKETMEIFPQRGEIYMQDRFSDIKSLASLFPVAINKDFYKVSAVPKDILEKEETIEKLSPLLGMDKEILQERIYKENDPYEPLKSKVEKEIAEQIKNLNLTGIFLEPETWRYFPSNEFACHITGFIRQSEGEKAIGQYGAEEYYETELAGKPGLVKIDKDSKGREIFTDKEIITKTEEGADIVLTLDSNIQTFAEQKLKEYIEKFSAQKGTVIVMDARNGAIEAMANWPKFNPNLYNEVKNIKDFSNSSIHDLYEPGSIFKPITMAAALDTKAVTPQTTYNDTGEIVVSGKVIKNALERGEGIQTMTQVIEKSLNTGAVFALQKTGNSVFKDYVEKFGFDDKTGIDLPGEVNGNIANLSSKIDINFATAAFGQGIAVTPIQLVSAFSAIANNGILLKPYVVEKIIYKDKKEQTFQKQEVRRVISASTASRITAMMVSAVEGGHTQRAGVEGYSVAAKTGTAQIPDKGGYSEETIHSLIGFFPAYNARFVMLVKLDKPIGIRFAEGTAAPLFGEIAKYILNYYEIPPTK